MKILIVINTKLHKEHEWFSEKLRKVFEIKKYEIEVLDLAINKMPYEKIELIHNIRPHLMVVMDMVGYEMKTTMGNATYNVLPYRMVNILLKDYDEYAEFLKEDFNFSMFFFANKELVRKIGNIHPWIENVFEMEITSIQEDEEIIFSQVIDQIIYTSEIELDFN